MSAPPPYNPEAQAYPPAQQGYPPAQPQAYPPPQAQAYPPQAYPDKPPVGAPYPPQAGYPQPPPQQQQSTVTTVVTAQPQVVVRPVFRDYPVVVTLADGRQVQTRLDYRSGLLTWIICLTVFFFVCLITGFLGPVGLVVFCISATKDVYHLDPEGNVVGVYKRI